MNNQTEQTKKPRGRPRKNVIPITDEQHRPEYTINLEKQQIDFYGKQKLNKEKSELEYNQYLAKQEQITREKNLTAYVVSIILVLIYLVLSSIANSFNPTTWSTSVVFAFICLMSLLIVLILIKIVAENEAKKDMAEIEDINQKLK